MKQSIKFVAVVVLMITVYSCFNDSTTPSVDYSSYTAEREDSIVAIFIDTMLNRGYDVDTTNLGVYYTILDEGDSIQRMVQNGDSIGITYTGFFADGNGIFDASTETWKYTYGAINLISGFDDAVAHLNKGGEGLFLVPSSLGYGSTGSRLIPPYSPLVFDIKLVDIYE